MVLFSVLNMTIMSNNNAYQLHDIGSENLLIWFGGRNEPFISNKMAHSTGCDVLSVKNILGDWYVGGIVGINGGVEGAISWLKEQIEKKSYKNIFIAGQSSGGYMALKMAHQFSPTAAIVFNPTTQNFPLDSKIFSPQRYPQRYQITNLNELYRSQPVAFPIVLNVGRSEKDHADKWKCDDLIHAQWFKEMDNVIYVQLPHDTHVLTAELSKKGMFYTYITNWIAMFLN